MIKDNSYSTKLRALSKDYSQKRLEISEYRSKRRVILNKIDKDLNGVKKEKIVDIDKNKDTLKLKKQVNSFDEVSIIMKTIAFFKK
ncbi:hypothetical protein MNBD_GAMMA07-2618 [hydrothermal vent metagenome]|uniref:Uncharacterized protein n=1 Tax=hydrothermal vent metagenome TaxID=652676 RepID=A0A3B0WLT1_9ZZZZ